MPTLKYGHRKRRCPLHRRPRRDLSEGPEEAESGDRCVSKWRKRHHEEQASRRMRLSGRAFG